MPHTLLLADDSVTIQRVIQLTFADEDIRVVAVGDGRQAIRELQNERPDIVLADVGMPEADGYEVAAFMKRTPDLASIPILLLTGAFEPIDEGRARAVGCDGVLVKPFEPQMVIARVKDLLKGRRRESDGAEVADPARRGFVTPDASSLGKFQPEASGGPPPSEAAARAATPPTPPNEYFDRLDSVFGAMEGATQPRPPGRVSPEEERLFEPEQPQVQVRSAPSEGQPPQSNPAPAAAEPARPVSLADAFAALLAAEQGRPFDSDATRNLAASDTFLELVTRRVIERLGDERMREAVLEVADRLVREEIERIKRSAGRPT